MSSFDNFVNNYLDWSDDMTRDINEDPMYWLGASFILGVFFASFSWGIIFYFIFLVLYSFGFYYYCYYNGINEWFLDEQFGLFAASFFGFLIGRSIIEDDEHKENMHEFKYRVKYWLEELDLCDSTDKVRTFWERKEKTKSKQRDKKRLQRLYRKGCKKDDKKGNEKICNYCYNLINGSKKDDKRKDDKRKECEKRKEYENSNNYVYTSNDSCSNSYSNSCSNSLNNYSNDYDLSYSSSNGVSSDSIDRLTIVGYNRFI